MAESRRDRGGVVKMQIRFIVDAGTSRLRISAVSADGNVLDRFSSDDGVMHTAIDGNNARLVSGLKTGFRTLMEKNGIQNSDLVSCICYGMITSNAGLLEVSHIPAPADAKKLHASLVRHDFPELLPCPFYFIPGVRVKNEGDAFSDMMRGEETEVLGLYELLATEKDAVYVLPGSHNKLILLDRTGKILDLKTTLSGELLSTLTQYTILKDTLGGSFPSEEEYDGARMLQGASYAEQEGLTHAAFMTRTMCILDGFSAKDARNFLLGLVLSQDLAALRAFSKDHPGLLVYVAGKAPMASALTDLFRENGFPAEVVPEEISAWMGIRGALLIDSGA